MSTFIGRVNGPHHNSPDEVAQVWCSAVGVEFALLKEGASLGLDLIAARNLVALLVRASEEVERMQERARRERTT